MAKRRINPATGEVELTYREEKLVDEYIKNGGNGKQAAAAAGYGVNGEPDAGACRGGRSLAARDSGPQHLIDSNPDLPGIEKRSSQCSFIPTRDSRLLTRDSERQLQQRQLFRRLGSKLKNLRKINATQCLSPSQPAPNSLDSLARPMEALIRFKMGW